MLQEFLNTNLISVNEDANFEKLKKASEEIAKRISKSRGKLISFTLAALDPSVSIDNPDVLEVKETIIKHWTTFLSNVKDTPVTYIKAVIFQALQSLSSDINISAVIYLTGVDSIEQFNLSKQTDLLRIFFETLGNNVEAHAMQYWALPSDVRAERVLLDTTPLTAEAFDKAELDKNLKAIKGSVNKLIAESNLEVEQRRVLQLRSQLLWWKESSYSNSLKIGYDAIDKSILPVVMAFDYSQLLPLVYPTSADYFFRNALNTAIQGDNKAVKIGDILENFKSNTNLNPIFAGYKEEKEKISLYNFLRGFAQGVYQINELGKLVGVDESKELPLTDYGLWILHNLQANKISLLK